MSTSEQAETATMRREIPLAYDANGEPLNVPENAIGWRVRRGGGRRGRPRIVFNHDGRQLEIGIESTIHDLADHDCAPGRYKLEAVTADGRLIPGCVAVTEIPVDDDDDGPDGQGGTPAPTALSVWDEAYKELHDRRRAMNEQNATFCRAFEAMAHAFGPVRALGGVSMPELPAMPATTDASAAPTMKMDQLMPLIMQALTMLPQIMGAVKAGVAQAVASPAAAGGGL